MKKANPLAPPSGGPRRAMNFTTPAGAASTCRTPSKTFEVQLVTTLQEVRGRFARGQGLPFSDSRSQASILDALNQHGVTFRDRVFSPVTTLWGFLSQVLSDDHSCRDAVSRILAHRAASGLEPCSPNPASYCNARSRLPTAVLRSLTRRTAQQLQAGLPEGGKWNGRSVFIADGSHVSMPDTPQNQAGYPQPVVQ